jgi:flagellar biosynthetic protein FlhB
MLIALVDVPYQLWSFMRKLRMTKQEVKQGTRTARGAPR